MGGDLDVHRDAGDAPGPSTDLGPRIEWHDVDDVGSDAPGGSDDASELLTADRAEHLDRQRVAVPVAELHPDRLAPPSAAERSAVERAWRADQHPDAWIGEINPGWSADAWAEQPGHTENCADCARAVQATWDGHPTAAGSIAAEGLPLQGGSEGGEHPAYTEQWAGRPSEVASYDEIGRRVADAEGSAIVFAHGDGGHAFNALWDSDRQRVIWADGQTGEVGDWPPAHLQERMPETRAIFFPEPRRPR
jgi:hypothetical protein